MSTVSKNRIRIFDYWQIQQPSLQSQPSVRKSSESYLADDQISEALRLVSNVTEFLQGKGNYQKKINNLRSQINDRFAALHRNCNSEAEDKEKAESNINIYKDNLKKQYISIREAKLLENRIESYFQNANLANYDPEITKLTFTEPSETMYQRLNQSISALRNAMHLLIQTQRLVDTGKELSNMFGKQHTPNFCLENLRELLAHENLVKIHFLMLFQLEQLQAMVNQLKEFIKVSQSEYLKYELVLDCIALMKLESDEMKKELIEQEQELQFACYHPTEVDYRAITAKNQLRAQTWKHNIRIYETNLQNFTRVNVETNMFYYSQLKAQFVESLDQFTHEISRYQIYNKSLVFLLDRQALLFDIQRRVELITKIGEPDRRLALSIYNECSSHVLPEDYPALSSLKDSLLSDIEFFLVNNGIAYNKQARERVPLEQDLIKHQAIIQQIESVPPSEQYGFISSKIKHINASSFELETFVKDKERLLSNRKGESQSTLQNKIRTINSYRLALIYAGIIGKPASFKSKLEEFDQTKYREGFEDLPIKFQNTFFSYVSDIATIEDSRRITEQINPFLGRASEELRESLTKSRVRGNIDGLLDKALEGLKPVWFELYHGYFRRISVYGQELMLDRLNEICSSIAECVRQSFPEDAQLINLKTMDIERKLFFTHRILNELVALTNRTTIRMESLKIVNISRILDEVFSYLDNEFISKGVGGKISEIVKLSLLEQYFSRIYGHGNLWRAIRTLKYIGYLESIAELYPSSDLGKEQILQALLKLQLEMNSLALSLKQSDEYKAILEEKVPPIIKEMRKFPLTLAAKHDISGFVAVFRFRQIIDELGQAYKSQFSITTIARIYVCICELKNARKASENSFDSYENVMVKERRSIEEYFQKARIAFKPKIQSISREIELATKNFLNKGESVDLSRAVQFLYKKAQ